MLNQFPIKLNRKPNGMPAYAGMTVDGAIHIDQELVLEHFPFTCIRHRCGSGCLLWFFLKENKWDARRSGHDDHSIRTDSALIRVGGRLARTSL